MQYFFSLYPYVMIELSGFSIDCNYGRTWAVPHNGCKPIFDETFEFRIMLPGVALLMSVVLQDYYIGHCFIGQYTKPVDCVGEGKLNSSSLS